MVTTSVLAHGPAGDAANWPFADVVVSVTCVSAVAGVTTVPVFSCTLIGPATVPAVKVTGGAANAIPVCVHVENPAHCVVNAAPGMTALWHHCSCAHAPIPGSFASTVSPE